MGKMVDLTWTNGDLVTTERVMLLEADDPICDEAGVDSGLFIGNFIEPSKQHFEDGKGVFQLTHDKIIEMRDIE